MYTKEEERKATYAHRHHQMRMPSMHITHIPTMRRTRSSDEVATSFEPGSARIGLRMVHESRGKGSVTTIERDLPKEEDLEGKTIKLLHITFDVSSPRLS